jgi:hypothetical protein
MLQCSEANFSFIKTLEAGLNWSRLSDLNRRPTLSIFTLTFMRSDEKE